MKGKGNDKAGQCQLVFGNKYLIFQISQNIFGKYFILF